MGPGAACGVGVSQGAMLHSGHLGPDWGAVQRESPQPCCPELLVDHSPSSHLGLLAKPKSPLLSCMLQGCSPQEKPSHLFPEGRRRPNYSS